MTTQNDTKDEMLDLEIDLNEYNANYGYKSLYEEAEIDKRIEELGIEFYDIDDEQQ